MVNQLERDLADLLPFVCFPEHPWRKLSSTNTIERCFAKVRRRARFMVCFGKV